MKLIDDWLRGGQPYTVGVRLYMQYGADKQMHRLFSSEGESAFKKQKLREALAALATGNKQPATGTHKPTPVASTQEVFAKSWPAAKNTSDTMRDLWEQARLLLKEIAEIHGKLDVVPDTDQRRKLAFELLRKDEELDGVYAQRDFYETHQKLPDVAPSFSPISDPYLMANRIASLKRYVRREKQKVAADANNQAAVLRLKQYTEEYNYYATKLGKPLC